MAGFRMLAGSTDQSEIANQETGPLRIIDGGIVRPANTPLRHWHPLHGGAFDEPHSLKARSKFLAPEKAFACAAPIRAEVMSVPLKLV